MKRKLIIIALLCIGAGICAQNTLSLDECRRRALEANKSLKQADAKRQQAHNLERAALWEMMPSVSAIGGYVWTEKSVELLSNEQKERIAHIGDQVEADLSTSIHNEFDNYPIAGQYISERLDDALVNSGLSANLNNAGQEIIDGLKTDTRNMSGVAITLNQPIYLGGKLAAMHRSAALLERMADVEYSKEERDVIVAVDEAYWQVVSVQHKRDLAERYAALLDTLENHVSLSVEADVATNGDLAKVRVKRNEAHMNLTKATNGLALAKMLLAERCGMPLDSQFVVDSVAPVSTFVTPLEADNLQGVYSRRPEIQMLRIGDSIAREGVRIAASSLKPNIVASAGYLMTNPNVFDGFSNTWGGTWMAGVVAQVPIFHPAGIYAVKAAKAKRREAAWKMQEAQELIELQVNKLQYEYELAWKKLTQAESNLEMAEENLRLADECFAAGMCGSSDLMAAQTAWLQAEGEVLDARIEIEMDKVYLKQALGE